MLNNNLYIIFIAIYLQDENIYTTFANANKKQIIKSGWQP